jgi:hypothetical protein
MRSLYLFLGEILTNERRSGPDRAWSEAADQELRPISPGSFARWMRARDQAEATPQRGAVVRRSPSRVIG